MMKKVLLVILLVSAFSLQASESYEKWQKARLENLIKPHSWLSLVAMEWLYLGENSIGSAQDNSIKLATGPAYIGRFILHSDNTLKFVPTETNQITANDHLVTKPIDVYPDTHPQGPTVFQVATYEFYVVERKKMALRIKDSQAETRLNFKGLEYFPEQEAYRIKADFIPYQPVKIIQTVNVMGQLYDEPSPGRLEFTLNGQKLSLDAFDGGDSYYLVFGDKTSGRTTYGPGRFLYSDGLVNEEGQVVLDFNKAYNPPCAFTAYSTCTLPPLQNRLNIEINAGEKKYGNSKY